MSVADWLLDSDPSVRWQVLRDLVEADDEVVSAERARVASDGWGARLLSLRGGDGQWAGGACFPADHQWGSEADGRTVALGAYFGQRMDALVDRLLAEQLDDGGWNCWTEHGSVRSSFHSTICVLEGLLAHEQARGASVATTDARRRAEEYLLARGLFRRLSTGEVVDPAWLQLSYPTRWHYDVLRGLEYFRAAGAVPDPRMAEAVEHVRSKQQPDGTWLLENTHPGEVHFALEDGDGRPSRWNTLRALRVLRWYDERRPA